MRRSYPDARPRVHQPPGSRRLACGQPTGLTSSHGSHPSDAITRIGNQHPDRLRTSGYLNNLSGCAVPIQMLRSYPDAPFLSGCNATKPHRGPSRASRLGPAGGHTPGAHPAQLRLVAATGAYKTRPDRSVRARNVFGSGVRTLAVVRAVLTTIATLTTPLRHVILLEFVV